MNVVYILSLSILLLFFTITVSTLVIIKFDLYLFKKYIYGLSHIIFSSKKTIYRYLISENTHSDFNIDFIRYRDYVVDSFNSDFNKNVDYKYLSNIICSKLVFINKYLEYLFVECGDYNSES